MYYKDSAKLARHLSKEDALLDNQIKNILQKLEKSSNVLELLVKKMKRQTDRQANRHYFKLMHKIFGK